MKNEETPLLHSLSSISSTNDSINTIDTNLNNNSKLLKKQSIFNFNKKKLLSHSSIQSFSQNNTKELYLNIENVSIACSPKKYLNKNDLNLNDDINHTCDLNDELSLLDPYFDMTYSRLNLIFKEMDLNNDGLISYDEFRKGLDKMGIHCENDKIFDKLATSIDLDNSNNITSNEFEIAIQKLKLADLFRPITIENIIDIKNYIPSIITIIDYSDKKIRKYNYLKDKDLELFFLNDRPDWVHVRWIHMDGHDDLNLKRLAIKYRLHPLAIEDALELHERPKFDIYDTHIFVVFPVLSIQYKQNNINNNDTIIIDDSNDNNNSSKHINKSKSKRKLNKSYTNNIKLSCCTSISLNLDLIDLYNNDFYVAIEHISIFVIGKSTVITIKDDTNHNNNRNTINNNKEKIIWDLIYTRLNTSYSKLRQNNGKFLLYAVLDVIVDQICNVMDTLTNYLNNLENELENLKHNFQINKLRLVKNELFKLPRLLKPAREVLKNLIDDKDIDEITTAYIRDVHDHIVQVLDDIELQLQLCRILTEDYRESKSNQMNYVLYNLSVATSIFLPAQFLTGVYGMNFENMPELHTKYGYYLFWMVVISIAIGLNIYFRHKSWI